MGKVSEEVQVANTQYRRKMGNSVWVESSETFLIEALLDKVQQGDRQENGFKKSVWREVVAALNAAYVQTPEDKPFTIAQAKSKELSVSFLILVAYKILLSLY